MRKNDEMRADFDGLLAQFLAAGAFADVFDLSDGTVVKIYRRVSHTHAAVIDWDDHDFITRRMYTVEVKAYERLQDFPELVQYVPRYYGPIDHASLNLDASNPTEPFIAGCAFRLERIDGQPVKIAHVEEEQQKAIEKVLEQIRDVSGRVDVWDCSCFIPGPRTPFVVIDFALWKDLVDTQLYLEEHKHLPEQVRQTLSLG